MTERCPTCGAHVGSIFEHVDVECREIGSAPRDGTVITGLYQGDTRTQIQWAEYRSHPGGGHGMRPGWVDTEMKYPIDAPEAWEPYND